MKASILYVVSCSALYVKSLKQDLQENLNTFDLKETLQDSDFFREFQRFTTENTVEFPQLYDLVWDILLFTNNK